MEPDVTIAEFKQHLKSMGYAPSTITSYRNGLNQFLRYLEARSIDDLRKVGHGVVREYQRAVMAEAIAVESKALKLRPVKRLFEYLVRSNRLLINPTEGIVETRRVNRKIGTVLTPEEVRRLLERPNLSLRTGIRDRAILEVLYATAMRLNEFANLEVYHADLSDKVLFVRKGKGGRQRVVPLGRTAAARLREYLEKVRPYHARKNPKERRLFVNQFGFAMSKASVRTMVRACRLGAGIEKPVSPHTLRRSCATHMLQNGADIRYVQKLLGHKMLSTTQQYTKTAAVDIKKTHADTHPGVGGKKDGDQ